MDDVKSIWNNLTPGKLMFYIILILILFAFFSSIFRRLRYGIPRKWIAKLGLYWDKEINPYCPKCRMLLHGVAQCCDVLHCPNCDQNFNLRFGNKIYALEDAVKDIKNKTI